MSGNKKNQRSGQPEVTGGKLSKRRDEDFNGGELKLKSQICCDVSGQVMAMMIMMMRHLSVKSKGLVKSLEEPVANTEAAVGPRLAILSD